MVGNTAEKPSFDTRAICPCFAGKYRVTAEGLEA
jgi:hypothetical protein